MHFQLHRTLSNGTARTPVHTELSLPADCKPINGGWECFNKLAIGTREFSLHRAYSGLLLDGRDVRAKRLAARLILCRCPITPSNLA